jgi:outer membrane receptor protein involved in Fe transport
MKRTGSLIAIFVVSIATALIVEKAQAQETGSISGIITDPSGAVIPGVNLKLSEIDTGVIRTTSSNERGAYAFSLVPPGNYVLDAQKQGFSTRSVQAIQLRVNDTLRYDFALQVGQIAEKVTVQASAETVNTETATIGEVINSQQMVATPLNGRSFIQLATLSAGVTPPDVNNARTESTTQGAGAGRPISTVSVSGVREVSPEFLMDGVLTRNAGYGAIGAQPPVDSVEEFNVQRGYFSPKFGLPAVINVVYKSGTNAFHGAVWEFFRNDILDAKSYFDKIKPPLRQNQFGVNVGGPIIKRRLFFFGDYEGLRSQVSTTEFHTVPTPQMLAGDFSGLPTIIDPFTQQPFPNNQIPANRIGNFAKGFNQFIPAPNTAPIAARGNANLVGATRNKLDDNRFDFKIDYSISEKDKLFGSFNFLNSAQETTSLLPGNGSNTPYRTRHAVTSWTHLFSPTLINDFRFGYDYTYLNSLGPIVKAGAPNYPSQLGLQNLNTIDVCNGPPAIFMTAFDRFGFVFSNCIIYENKDKYFIDNLSWVKGRHTIGIGGQLIRVDLPEIASFTQNGRFQYSGQFTHNAAADYLLDAPFTVSGANVGGTTEYLGWNPDLYINDDWKVTPKLTLNIGLRWQYTQPPVENHDNQFDLNFTTGAVTRAGTNGVPRGIYNSGYTDFAPRIGIAYAIGPNTAVRTSYGIFWDRLPGDEVNFNSLSFPFTISSSFTSDPTIPTINMSTLFPGAVGNTPPPGSSFFNLKAPRSQPYLQQWTLSVQRNMPWNMFAEVAYIGSKGTHLSKRVDANLARLQKPGENLSVAQRRPLPQYSFILSDQSIANSWYHGLQLTVRKNFSKGLSFLSGYTFSKSLDNDSYDGKGSRNYRPGDLDKGRSIFDMKHRWTTSFIYELPFGQHLAGPAKQLVGGWELSGIVTIASGLPFQARTGADFSNTGSFWLPRPNRICNGNLPSSQRTPNRWFDTSCFVNPPLNTYGNGGVAYLDTDGQENVDLAIIKHFAFSESKRIEFRTEFFNAFNHATFGRPGTVVGTPQFGVVTTSLPGRIIQFGAKLEF